MNNFNEKFREGTLQAGRKYYCRTKYGVDIYEFNIENNECDEIKYWYLENKLFRYNNKYHLNDIKVIIPIPTCEKLQEIKEQNTKLKKQNKRLREIIKMCQRYLDNQSVTDAWGGVIKMDIDDSMSDLGMEKIE